MDAVQRANTLDDPGYHMPSPKAGQAKGTSAVNTKGYVPEACVVGGADTADGYLAVNDGNSGNTNGSGGVAHDQADDAFLQTLPAAVGPPATTYTAQSSRSADPSYAHVLAAAKARGRQMVETEYSTAENTGDNGCVFAHHGADTRSARGRGGLRVHWAGGTWCPAHVLQSMQSNDNPSIT